MFEYKCEQLFPEYYGGTKHTEPKKRDKLQFLKSNLLNVITEKSKNQYKFIMNNINSLNSKYFKYQLSQKQQQQQEQKLLNNEKNKSNEKINEKVEIKKTKEEETKKTKEENERKEILGKKFMTLHNLYKYKMNIKNTEILTFDFKIDLNEVSTNNMDNSSSSTNNSTNNSKKKNLKKNYNNNNTNIQKSESLSSLNIIEKSPSLQLISSFMEDDNESNNFY
jgi:hypothetical protein